MRLVAPLLLLPTSATYLAGRPRCPPVAPFSSGRAASAFITLNQPPPPPVRNLEGLVSSFLQAAEDASKVASEAADQWVNSGWQVQKSAGKAVPEIVPTAASPSPPPTLELVQNPPELGLAGATGSLAQVDKQASALLAPTQESLELQEEFVGFLAPKEGSAYRTTEAGEIVFASREDLAALVADFSYAKLRELAAASRALARYVDDLEGELEAADDAVVGLRRQVSAEKDALAEAERANSELQARADVYAAELAAAQSGLEAQQMELADAEQAAERAASQLLERQQQAASEATTSSDEQRARAVALETELMQAESAAAELATAKERLELKVTSLAEQQRFAAEQRQQEQAALAALERRASDAEAAAETKASELASELARSESSVAALQAQLEELKAAVDAPSRASNGAANGVANGAAAAAPVAAAAPFVPSNGKKAKKSKQPASDAGGAALAADSFSSEAAQLTKEIEEQLRGTGLMTPKPGAAGADEPAPRLALSRMKKADLVAECTERKLNAEGTVAELRAQLRVERKRDTLVLQLVERGWSDRQSRSALEKANWDLDAAIATLAGT